MTKDNGIGSYLSDWTIPSPEAEMQPLEKLIWTAKSKKVRRVGLFKKKIVTRNVKDLDIRLNRVVLKGFIQLIIQKAIMSIYITTKETIQ